MNLDEYSGPTVVLLTHGYDSDAPLAAFPDEDAAALELGRALLGRSAVLTGWKLAAWDLERVPAPDLVEHSVETGHEPESVGDLEALAATISFARTGRPWHEVRTTPGGVGDHEAARKVLEVVGQRMRDARSMAAQDDEHERRLMADVLQLQRADGKLPSWAEIRGRARRVRELGGEAFVAQLRERLAPLHGTAAHDAGRPDLLGMVASVVNRVTQLQGDDPDRVQLDPEAVERAARALHDPKHTTPWESQDGRTQGRYVDEAQAVVRAYLAEPED